MAEEKLPFTEHLSELRKRIIITLVFLLVAFIATFSVSEFLFRIITLPLREKIAFSLTAPFVRFIPLEAQITSLVFLAPAEAFWMHIKVSIIAAIIVSLPVILYELWQFIAPGLLSTEKKYVAPFILVASSLFVLGAAFCFFVILPFAMGFLLTYKTESLTPMLSVGAYTDFCLKFIVAFGAIFELPIVIVFLTKMGIVSTQSLAKNRKYALLLAFVIAAVLTPTPDAFNQTLMAVPILILYEVGIIVSRFITKKKDKQ
ncbi:MAG: twin-arginine translocase subunit TatC [Thermodesulfovibrionales bacterium]